MSDEEYWSEDSCEEIELIQDNRDFPQSESESEDEEEYNYYMNLIKNKLNEKELNDKLYFKKESLPKESVNKKSISKKPINKDYVDKNINVITINNRSNKKRQFNPRLPPPGDKFKKK